MIWFITKDDSALDEKFKGTSILSHDGKNGYPVAFFTNEERAQEVCNKLNGYECMNRVLNGCSN